MTKEKIKFKKWKEETIESINEIVITNHIAFDEYMDSLFDLAFAKGRNKGARDFQKLLKKFYKIPEN